jgi:hypothetical protein
MNANAIEDRKQCQLGCEDEFISCTSRQPSGCAEALRLCREGCPPAAAGSRESYY